MSATTERTRSLYDRHGEKVRYLLVGVWNTAFGYGLYFLLITFFAVPLQTKTGLTSRAAALAIQWAAWVVAVVQSTIAMKYFAFRSSGRLGPQILRAYVVYLPAQGLSSLILYASMRVLGLTALAGQLIAVVVTTIISYLGHKYFTFQVPLEVGEVPPHDLIE